MRIGAWFYKMNIRALFLFTNCSLKTVTARKFSVSTSRNKHHSCKLLIVGGGSGGCTIASKFARRLGKGSVIVLEPSSSHYYQPLWTLVGAGVTPVEATRRDERSVLPSGVTWIQDRADCLNASDGSGQFQVQTRNGHTIDYEYMVVAVGLQNDYKKVPGLEDALKDTKSGVSTIYDSQYCTKTWADLQRFGGGHAIFTYPDTPIKCPGAPQKIAYLAESYFTKRNIRANTTVAYNTCLPVIFGVKKYADALVKVAERKQIQVNYQTVLKEIKLDSKEAVFKVTGSQPEETTMPYDLLHVTPPMKTPDFLQTSRHVTDACGFLDVDQYTLQHKKYNNIFGIGDCTNTPNSKTAAAIAKQCYVLEQNLLSAMAGRPLAAKYDGYGACPLLTSYGTCILAEFLYGGVVHETFPFDQSKESRLAYYMKKHLFPFIYWNFMLRGYYHGPEFVRKIVNPLGK